MRSVIMILCVLMLGGCLAPSVKERQRTIQEEIKAGKRPSLIRGIYLLEQNP